MKRIYKSLESEIIRQNLSYKKGDNSRLRRILQTEQKSFCAYTEEYIDFNDAADVDHFNPQLKFNSGDNYHNWFLVKHKPNNRKSRNWIEPMLHPCHADFEQRIIYDDGVFFYDPDDVEAKNLIDLLDLNNEINVRNRKRYIQRRKERISENYIEASAYFRNLVASEIAMVKYLRAIQEEFHIDIWSMIPDVES
jgi:hypothetical protein